MLVDSSSLFGVAVASFALGYSLHVIISKSVEKPVSSSLSSITAASSSTSTSIITTATTTITPLPLPLRPATAAEVVAAQELEESLLSDSALVGPGELKMVICVRSDLEMSKGKIAAQVGHAVLGAVRVAGRLPLASEWVKAWLFRAQAKITLKVESEAQMNAVAAAAAEAGLPHMIIEDAGRTEVEPGTRTVVGIGPAPVDIINAITGPKGRFPLRLLS
jgi:PTH2 family peptidyl-tRNA hydrolase